MKWIYINVAQWLYSLAILTFMLLMNGHLRWGLVKMVALILLNGYVHGVFNFTLITNMHLNSVVEMVRNDSLYSLGDVNIHADDEQNWTVL